MGFRGYRREDGGVGVRNHVVVMSSVSCANAVVEQIGRALLAAGSIGELAKPFSLALRLFGNITGEDTLIAVFVVFGVAILSFSPVGLPLQIPFYFLGLLLSTIQALVFTLLSTIYILLMLPHEEHAH